MNTGTSSSSNAATTCASGGGAAAAAGPAHIKVFCRLRPQNAAEKKAGGVTW